MRTPPIHYLVPDYDQPSWGTALLYEHVALLRELGFDARVLHHRAPFRLTWFEGEVPIAHLDALDEAPGEDDLLVVPETLAAPAARLSWRCRRIVFVQNSFLVARSLEGASGYPELGYEAAFAVLPHVARVVEDHCGLSAEVVPPFIAPYFFRDPDEARARSRTVLLTVKPEHRAAGFPDYNLFTTILGRRLRDWRLVELQGLRHQEVARLMADAAFLVNLNTHEAFNSTVPEAMAAGCVPLCYDAFGGQDFLIDEENAFVFPNHHVFPLIDRLLRSMAAGAAAPELDRMRRAGRRTAEGYTRADTRTALERAVRGLLGAERG